MKVNDAIEILRPINCLMGSLTVIIGLLNTRTGVLPNKFLLNIIFGIIAYFFIAGSGMVINDIYDIEIDRINRPQRPIPRGSISLSQARGLFLTYLIIGLIASVVNSILNSIGFLNVIIAAIFGFIGWIYAKWGKKSGFLGNIIVSVSFSIGIIYGAVLNSSIISIYVYFFFFTSFFLLLSRELIKGCEDIEGDKLQGVKTLAIKIGIKKSKYISMFFAIIAILFFVLTYFTPIINPFYFLITMVFGLVDVCFVIILILIMSQNKKDFKRISLFLKIGAFLGLVAFLFASL
ncbi:MAG: geranylgeranylglycerol-phosphate geranylgeranyltransferase [Candidatus Lokiarchaeota archaeon]|jgi:geranylgeranylglycerol-phosphate geranylgeranyltransferase